MKLITTVTWTFEQDVDVVDDWVADGYTKEEYMENQEQFTYEEVIGRIEGRIDNICLSNWSRDSVDMKWEDN